MLQYVSKCTCKTTLANSIMIPTAAIILCAFRLPNNNGRVLLLFIRNYQFTPEYINLCDSSGRTKCVIAIFLP